MSESFSTIPNACRLVPEFGDYAVSADGIVWSRKNCHGGIGTWKRLRGTVNSHGYVVVTLCRENREFKVGVHSLVLSAFIGPCPEGMEACHFPDRTRTNNRLDNLRWDTRSENHLDMRFHDTDTRGWNHPLASLTKEQVKEIRSSSSSGKELATMFGVSRATISRVRNQVTYQVG